MVTRQISRELPSGKDFHLRIEAYLLAALLPRAIQLDLLRWQGDGETWEQIHQRLCALLREQQKLRLAA